jgi:hypothetical protein
MLSGMKDPETAKLIIATERCVRDSQRLIRYMRSSVRADIAHIEEIRRIIDELNGALKSGIQKDDSK